jgi:hypothetical protein
MVQDSGQASGREPGHGALHTKFSALSVLRPVFATLGYWHSGPTKLADVHREAMIRSGALPSSTQCSMVLTGSRCLPSASVAPRRLSPGVSRFCRIDVLCWFSLKWRFGALDTGKPNWL